MLAVEKNAQDIYSDLAVHCLDAARSKQLGEIGISSEKIIETVRKIAGK